MKTNSILIVGDFNLPDINWPTLTSSAVHSDCSCEAKEIIFSIIIIM